MPKSKKNERFIVAGEAEHLGKNSILLKYKPSEKDLKIIDEIVSQPSKAVQKLKSIITNSFNIQTIFYFSIARYPLQFYF